MRAARRAPRSALRKDYGHDLRPIFAGKKERKGRYYVRDNFLRSWLHALAPAIQAINFRPVDDLIAQADERLKEAEGHALERLVAKIYEERSRKRLSGFNLTHSVEGYWDSAGTEIDLIAVDDHARTIRFGHVRRSADRLAAGLAMYEGHIGRFLEARGAYRGYRVEKVAIAPRIEPERGESLRRMGWLAEDLVSLTDGL